MQSASQGPNGNGAVCRGLAVHRFHTLGAHEVRWELVMEATKALGIDTTIGLVVLKVGTRQRGRVGTESERA